jgi:hypothetical protein
LQNRGEGVPVRESAKYRRFDDVARAVAGAGPSCGATRVVAVDGPSGSGKTLWASRLARAAGAPVLHMDDLYPGWDGLAASVGRLRREVLEPLSAGRPARFRRWDWAADAYGEEHGDVPVADVLVVEGVGSGARAVKELLSLLVWIEAPRPLRYERAMARDGAGYRPHWRRWEAQELTYFATDAPRDRAGLHVDGAVEDDATGFAVLRP